MQASTRVAFEARDLDAPGAFDAEALEARERSPSAHAHEIYAHLTYRGCGRAASRTSPRSAPIRRTADTESRSIGTAWPPLPVFGSRCRDSSGMRRPSLVTSSAVYSLARYGR